MRGKGVKRTELFAALATLSLAACPGGGYVAVDEARELYFGIPSRIQALLPRGHEDGLRLAWAEFERIGRVVNPFDPASEVARLNSALKYGPVEVSSDVWALFLASRRAWEETGGAFDPTVWPLKVLWREAAHAGRMPAKEAEARARVGLGRVKADKEGRLVFEVPDAGLDFGGIAKGYAVDRVASLLRGLGAASGMVQCGGEVQVWGLARDRSPWRIGVRDPDRVGQAVGVITGPEFLAVSTTGNYEQPVVVSGEVHGHVIDPRTGVPTGQTVLSVTVAVLKGDDANTRADALATGLYVLGPEHGLAIVESLDGVAALFLVRAVDGSVHQLVSSRMAPIYRPL